MYSNLSYSPETPNLGQIRRFLELCDLATWRMTLNNNRAPLLSNIKLCASFHHDIWIHTGVTVRKRLSWLLTSVTLAFDLWPWPFAWTSLLSLVTTPENFMMIRWWEHSEKGVTDRPTDRRADRKDHSYSCLVAAKNILAYMGFRQRRPSIDVQRTPIYVCGILHRVSHMSVDGAHHRKSVLW